MAAKLTPKMLEEIEKRLLAGEGIRALAREFNVSDTAIRKRLGSQVKTIKAVANKLVTIEAEVRELPLSSQVKVRSLANDLAKIRDNLLSAAIAGSDTASKLARCANRQAALVNQNDPAATDISRTALKNITVLTKLATDAASIPLQVAALAQRSNEVDPNDVKPKKSLSDFYAEIEN